MRILCICGLCVFFTGVSTSLSAEVRVRVKDDVYVLPVAELASTKTYPELIEFENDAVIVQLLPNRGRVLSSYTVKAGGLSPLYSELQPNPMVLPGGLHRVEFGGYYLSLPWNTRDRQPYDLAFEITESGPDQAEVYLSGRDMFKRTLTECWVRIVDGSPVIEVALSVTNTSSRKPREIDFNDFLVFSVNTDGREDAKILLPVDEVIVEQSTDDWLGSPGDKIPWTSRTGSWRNMKQYFNVRASGGLELPCISVLYPQSRAAFVKFWGESDLFENVQVWSWGGSYHETEGADAYLVASAGTAPFTLQPEEAVSFTFFLTALTGVRDDSSLQDLYQRVQSMKR
jgi:hypothetical protein